MLYNTIGPTIRYDTRCYFNVRSKADMSQLNLPHGTDDRMLLKGYTKYKLVVQVCHWNLSRSTRLSSLLPVEQLLTSKVTTNPMSSKMHSALLSWSPVYWHCSARVVWGARSMKRSSVRPSVPLFDRSRGVRRVCCWAPCGQQISIDSGGRRAPSSSGAAARRTAANASSVTLSADVGCSTQTCSYCKFIGPIYEWSL